MSLALSDPRHGSANAYNNYACRCAICRAAHSERQREKYRTRQPRTLLAHDERHGTTAGYNAGCRCDRCRAAIAEYTRSRRAKAKDGAA